MLKNINKLSDNQRTFIFTAVATLGSILVVEGGKFLVTKILPNGKVEAKPVA